MASAVTDKVKERRDRVLLGPLPPDFLRINASVQQQQEAADRQAALALQQAQMQYAQSPYGVNIIGRLSITIAQAKLVKNYGMTRMDPYCRVRVGHTIYETHTDPNGGKNPRWNKVMMCLLPQDELIAWSHISIPASVLKGQTCEDWFPLTGKQGDNAEGTINLVISFTPHVPVAPPTMMVPNVGGARGITPMPVYAAPQQVAPPVLSESELKQIEEMFPNIDKEVIKSVFEASRGNKDETINSLLNMCE